MVTWKASQLFIAQTICGSFVKIQYALKPTYEMTMLRLTSWWKAIGIEVEESRCNIAVQVF